MKSIKPRDACNWARSSRGKLASVMLKASEFRGPLLVSGLAIACVYGLQTREIAIAEEFRGNGGGTDASAPAPQEDYKLGPQDKVRVMVFEWRPSRDEIFAWSALNAEYVVGASGKLALPLVGEVRAAGISTRELSLLIGESLKDRMGLAATPDTAVEVVQFRPFYMTGSVEKPGEYPYRPGLTVLQAVSISGGMMRAADSSMMRLQRDSLTTRGELELLDKERDALLARKSRLQAEFQRLSEVTFPADLLRRSTTDPSTAQLIEQERVVFNTRKGSFDTQMKTLEQLKDYLQKEVESSAGQLSAHRRQIELMKQELEGVRSLADKGLATAPRKLALERNLAQLEGDGLRLEGSVVKVRQDISRNDISMVELETKRSGDVATELQSTQFALDQTVHKTDTANKLLYESEVVAPQLTSEYSRGRKLEPRYKIVRMTGGQSVEIDADETTALQPGDTVKVKLPSVREQTPARLEPAIVEPRIEPLGTAPKRAALEGVKRVED